MRLDKFLGEQGIGTRKQIKEYVKNGRCIVNGIVATKSDIHIDENNDEIAFDGIVISYQKYHYYMLNKPADVVSATYDGKNTTVIDLLRDENVKGLSPVGRLDIDTEGLILLTDDGALIHRLLAPKKHVDKVYEVHIKNDLTDAQIKRLEEGVDIGDKKDNGEIYYTRPAKVEIVGDKVIHLTIHEGRFHQVKRMLEAVDNEVLFLKRLSMGPIKLDETLEKGDYRPLTEEEMKSLGI